MALAGARHGAPPQNQPQGRPKCTQARRDIVCNLDVFQIPYGGVRSRTPRLVAHRAAPRRALEEGAVVLVPGRGRKGIG